MRISKKQGVVCLLLIVLIHTFVRQALAASLMPETPPATALFVINSAGANYDQFIPVIKDNLTSLLTKKGFSIVRTENALLPVGLPDSNENKTSSPEAEASLNRLAESLSARLMVVSTINAVTHDEKHFDGTGTIYKVVTNTAIDNVRINLQIFDLGSTKSVYGDSVSTSLRSPVYEKNQTNTILINLFYEAAVKITDNIANQVALINSSATAPSKKVAFSVKANIPSVDVFIDGMVVGSAGDEVELQASPGIHQLKLGKEFTKSWEKTVNIIDGAKYNVTLELTKEGLARFQSIQKFNLAMKAAETVIDVVKEQSTAIATETVEIAKGERVKRENSSVKDDGFADNLNKVIHGNK